MGTWEFPELEPNHGTVVISLGKKKGLGVTQAPEWAAGE